MKHAENNVDAVCDEILGKCRNGEQIRLKELLEEVVSSKLDVFEKSSLIYRIYELGIPFCDDYISLEEIDLKKILEELNQKSDSDKGISDELVQLYLQELRDFLPLSEEQEYETVRKAAEGSKEALDLLLKSNMKLVFQIAGEYADHGIYTVNLIQEGDFALIRAAELYDFTKGIPFRMFAAWWIHHFMTQEIREEKESVYNTISEEEGVSDESIFIEEEPDPRTIVTAEQAEKYLPALPMREEKMIRMLFGLDGTGKQKTIREITEELHITRFRTDRIVRKNLYKIKQMLNMDQ